MKKLIFSLILLSLIFQGYSQVNRFSKEVPTATYTPSTFDELLYAPRIMKERYDQNAAKVDDLINWIFELKKQTTESQFLNAMDVYYKLLKTFYEKDLARYDDQIRKVKFSIMEEIEKYNIRIKARETLQRPAYSNEGKMNNQNTGDYNNYNGQYLYKTTFDDPAFSPPLRDAPNADARIIYSCPVTAIVFVIDYTTNDKYCVVYVNGYTGYLSKAFLKSQR